MSTSETLPLFNTEKPSANTSTNNSIIDAVRETKFPPYYEDGPIRYYAVKTWENIVWALSVCLVIVFEQSERYYGPYVDYYYLKEIIMIFRIWFVDMSLAMVVAAIVSGRPRHFCRMFYITHHNVCPKSMKDYMVKFILGKN